MDLLLENLAHVLAEVYGHYVHGLRQPEDYSSGLLNELVSLTAAALSAVGIDPNSTDDRAEIRAVRETVGREFGVSPSDDHGRTLFD